MTPELLALLRDPENPVGSLEDARRFIKWYDSHQEGGYTAWDETRYAYAMRLVLCSPVVSDCLVAPCDHSVEEGPVRPRPTDV